MPESEDWPEGRPVESADKSRATDGITGSPAAAARVRDQTKWVDLQVKQAIERGEFDNLPGAGKPIKDLGSEHDPDWWLKQLIEREQITGVLPASVQLRKDDAGLDALLDEEATETAARTVVEAFNERVVAARYRLPEGPPLITMPRDVEETLAAWRERRAARAEADRVRREALPERPAKRQRWWRHRRDDHHPTHE